MVNIIIGYVIPVILGIYLIYSIYNFMKIKKYYGRKVYIRPEACSLAPYGYITNKKGNKYTLSILVLGCRYEKIFSKEMLMLE